MDIHIMSSPTLRCSGIPIHVRLPASPRRVSTSLGRPVVSAQPASISIVPLRSACSTPHFQNVGVKSRILRFSQIITRRLKHTFRIDAWLPFRYRWCCSDIFQDLRYYIYFCTVRERRHWISRLPAWAAIVLLTKLLIEARRRRHPHLLYVTIPGRSPDFSSMSSASLASAPECAPRCTGTFHLIFQFYSVKMSSNNASRKCLGLK